MVRPVAQNCRSHRREPSAALKQITCNCCCFGPLEQFTITRSLVMIGLLRTRTGRSLAQCTLSALSLAGSDVSSETPFPWGPRNCGQSAAGEVETTHAKVKVRTPSFLIKLKVESLRS